MLIANQLSLIILPFLADLRYLLDYTPFVKFISISHGSAARLSILSKENVYKIKKIFLDYEQ